MMNHHHHHNHSPEDPPLLMNHVNHNNNHSGLEYLKKNGKEKLAKATQPYERPRLVAKNGECLIKPVRLPNAYLVTYRWVNVNGNLDMQADAKVRKNVANAHSFNNVEIN